MDLQQIKALIDALEASDLSELEYSQHGSTLRLAKHGSPTTWQADNPAPATPVANPSPIPTGGVASRTPVELCSPVYGVVHLRPSPGEPLFVTVGDVVAPGQTLCVIEAMKVFNEVRAEQAATVEAVLVGSGQEVEAGQALFRFADATTNATKATHV